MLRYIKVHTSKRVEIQYQDEKFPIDYSVNVTVIDTGIPLVLNIVEVEKLIETLKAKPIEKALKKPTLENISRLVALKLYRRLKNTPYLLMLVVRIDGGSGTYAEIELNAEEVLLTTGGQQ